MAHYSPDVKMSGHLLFRSDLGAKLPKKKEEGSLLALLLQTPCFQDCLCGVENPSCGLIGNFLLALQPMLNVAACGFCAGQPERLTTNESDGFSLYFPDVPVDLFKVNKLLRSRVAEDDVGYFVQSGLERKRRNWANGYLALTREALHVAIDFIKWSAGNVERMQGGLKVKAGNRLLVRGFSLGLCQDKPIVTENEALPHLLLIPFSFLPC